MNVNGDSFNSFSVSGYYGGLIWYGQYYDQVVSQFSYYDGVLYGRIEQTFYQPSIAIALASGVPELSTWAMMLLGFVGLGAASRAKLAKA